MADYSGTVNSSVYSGKEFKCYIGADATVGTLNASTNGVTMYRLDVEGITLPSFSPNQEFEMRSGAGRVAEFGQIFSSSKRTTTEVSLSGRVTLQDLPILVENVLSQEATTGNNLHLIATGYNPTAFKHGDATGATVFGKTLTLFFEAPTTADSYTLKGCVCTSLNLSADMGTASGRYNFDATFQTQYIPTKATDSMSAAFELTTTLGSTYVFMSDQSTKDMNVMDYDGSTDATSINPILNSFNLTIESPSQFLGAQGANAEPEAFARAVPELTITIGGSFKYDTETDKLIEAFRDSGGVSFMQLILNNRAVTSDLETLGSLAIAAHADQTFGVLVPKAKLTSAEVASEDVSLVNFEAKVLDPGSNKVIHIATGATA
jgi:hypothetical protein